MDGRAIRVSLHGRRHELWLLHILRRTKTLITEYTNTVSQLTHLIMLIKNNNNTLMEHYILRNYPRIIK